MILHGQNVCFLNGHFQYLAPPRFSRGMDNVLIATWGPCVRVLRGGSGFRIYGETARKEALLPAKKSTLTFTLSPSCKQLSTLDWLGRRHHRKSRNDTRLFLRENISFASFPLHLSANQRWIMGEPHLRRRSGAWEPRMDCLEASWICLLRIKPLLKFRFNSFIQFNS